MKMKLSGSVFCLILIEFFNYFIQINGDEILGCGGFLKSHADIDFSKVEIKLLTKQGSLKDKTDCSPSNGYYFLPVYDKGEYILKISPPPGWSFEPEQIEINFDGKTDECSQGKDVNFAFKGFGITGRISGTDRSTGIKDIYVQLSSEDQKDVRQTVSDVNGIFYFTPVIPGKYTISVSRKYWHFENSQYVVQVKTGNTELPKDTFVVSGFDVQGRIFNDGQPLQNVDFVLFNRKNQKQASKCQSTNLPSIISKHNDYDSKPLCVTVPNTAGQFVFNSISPGQYLIKPNIQNKNIQFHIRPEFIEFEVAKEAVELNQRFEITGFSVSGRVLAAPNGVGVRNAKVIVNGQEAAIAHTDGSYTLKNIKAGTYTIQAIAPDVQFDEKTVTISTSNPSVPDVVVSAFKVCGNVVSHESYTIAITKHASTFHTQATSQKETGEWCTYLPTGRYTIQILTSAEDTAQGIQFFPKQQNIEVGTSPLSGIVFSQLRATVTGDVKCLSDPEGAAHCKAITITLNPLDADGKRTGQAIKATLKDGKYSFADVLPGTYEVSVPTNLLCWESNTLALNVKAAAEVIPTFVHTGYLVSVSSSHNVKMQYKIKGGKAQESASKEILLAPGLNSFCVDKFCDYDLTFSGCHTYDPNNLRTSFNPGDSSPIIVNAIKHKNGLQILSNVKAPFKVLVEQTNEKKHYTLVEQPNKLNGKFVYRYEFDLASEERIIVTPQSDIMLFTPESKEILGANDCVENAFTFSAVKGLIINGKVTPPIADVKVTLSFPQNPELSDLETVTTSNGAFKFGPLNENLDVQLNAFKESYVFSEYDKERNEFKAHKLCEIVATVKDEQGNKLSGVLLSLSGAESYRKNLVTGEDGTINFHSLSPSQYFLRPMMKEYRFEPASKIIDVKAGATVKVELNGKRVAFSVFGSITSLNGEPFSNIVVEARSEDRCGQHQEEAATEANGQYRIRGLQPGCEYTINVRSDSENIVAVDRTIPSSHKITVQQEDVHDVKIIAINPLPQVDVIARIVASHNDHYKSLRVQLYRKGNSDSPIYSQRVDPPLNVKSRINPGVMVFFPRIPFDGKTYVIELTTTLSDKNYKYTLPVESFVTNRSTIYTELEFYPEIRLNESDLNQNSISALILLGLVIIAFFKQDLAMELVTFLWDKANALVQNMVNSATNRRKDNRNDFAYNEQEIEKLAQSINATKKKTVRKT